MADSVVHVWMHGIWNWTSASPLGCVCGARLVPHPVSGMPQPWTHPGCKTNTLCPLRCLLQSAALCVILPWAPKGINSPNVLSAVSIWACFCLLEVHLCVSCNASHVSAADGRKATLFVLCPGQHSAVAEGSISPRSHRGGEEYLLAALGNKWIYLICISRWAR